MRLCGQGRRDKASGGIAQRVGCPFTVALAQPQTQQLIRDDCHKHETCQYAEDAERDAELREGEHRRLLAMRRGAEQNRCDTQDNADHPAESIA